MRTPSPLKFNGAIWLLCTLNCHLIVVYRVPIILHRLLLLHRLIVVYPLYCIVFVVVGSCCIGCYTSVVVRPRRRVLLVHSSSCLIVVFSFISSHIRPCAFLVIVSMNAHRSNNIVLSLIYCYTIDLVLFNTLGFYDECTNKLSLMCCYCCSFSGIVVLLRYCLKEMHKDGMIRYPLSLPRCNFCHWRVSATQ